MMGDNKGRQKPRECRFLHIAKGRSRKDLRGTESKKRDEKNRAEKDTRNLKRRERGRELRDDTDIRRETEKKEQEQKRKRNNYVACQ